MRIIRQLTRANARHVDGRPDTRATRKLEPGVRRSHAAGSGFAAHVTKLVHRLLNAVAPGGRRADSNARASKETKRQVGKLLDTLAAPTGNVVMDRLAANQIIVGLRGKLHPMPSGVLPANFQERKEIENRRDEKYESALQSPVEQHVRDMSTDQLKQLEQCLANTDEPVLDARGGREPLFRVIQAAVANELDRRAPKAAGDEPGDRFNQATTEFSRRSASLPAADLAQAVIATAVHFEAYQAVSEPGLPRNSRTDTLVKVNRLALEVELNMLLESGDFAMAKLDGSQLRALGTAFATLGVTRGCELIAVETGTRYTRDVQDATAAMRNWNPTGVLKAVQASQRKLDEIILQQTLAGRPSGDFRQLRDDLIDKAMVGLSPDELRALGKAMDDVNATKLTAAMAESGMALMPEHPSLGKEIVELTFGVGAIRAAVARAHKALEPDAPDAKPYGKFNLSTAMGGVGVAPALRDVFGIEVGTRENVNIKVGVATDFVQDSLKGNIRETVDKPSITHTLTDGRSTGVSRVLWQGLGRVDYAVLDSDGMSVPLIGRSANWDSDEARFGAVGQLRELTGNNPKLLMALSTVANPDAMMGIGNAMRSQHSPISLPDGTPGELLGRSESSFTIRSDGQGGLRVACSYTIRDATHLSVVGAEGSAKPIKLREGAYANFTFEVAISPDGTLPEMPLTEPLHVEYEAKPDLWTKDYKKPGHVSEILAQDRNSPMRADFRESVKNHYQAECLDFYEELEAFNPKSDEEARGQAQELVKKYITAGADMQVNISSDEVGEITAKILNANNMNAQELREVFAKAESESLTLMQTNNLHLFVKDYTAAE